MSPLDLLLPEAAHEAVPFSVRLAERRMGQTAAARSDRRAYPRRSARDLEWLRAVRLTGGIGLGVTLIDLSEGGALLEVDAPLRPGIMLTLEISGSGLAVMAPLEVLRCYVASLRDQVTFYRGACVFTHAIELPAESASRASKSVGFVGTDAALTYLLERCETGVAPPSLSAFGPRVTLERTEVLHVLESLHARGSTGGPDPLSRHATELLGAILPALHRGAPRQVVVAALEERLRGLPAGWQSRLQPTRGRLVSLIEHCVHCVPPLSDGSTVGSASGGSTLTPAAVPVDLAAASAGLRPLQPRTSERGRNRFAEAADVRPGSSQAETAFQKIVVRYADGEILKGYTQDFHPSRAQFSLWPTINAAPVDRSVVPMARLKAVFFVRDFNGKPGYRERKTFTVRGQGRRVEVIFADSEIVCGTTLNYRSDGQGFFVVPADPAANNTRIFVVPSAVRRIRFL